MLPGIYVFLWRNMMDATFTFFVLGIYIGLIHVALALCYDFFYFDEFLL